MQKSDRPEAIVDDEQRDVGRARGVVLRGVAGHADDRAVVRVDRGERLVGDVVDVGARSGLSPLTPP